MEYYRIILYIIFGILPSLAWLFYYLTNDSHPEPKKMILTVFLWGMATTIPVLLIQIGLSGLIKKLELFVFFTNYPIVIDILKWFVVVALTEEIFKYLAVKLTVFKSYQLDEPLDVMLYMVIAALGFAALENIFYLFSPIDAVSFNMIIQTTIIISFIRFTGATLLHTLCSALLGYFLALSFLETKKRLQLTMVGIVIAVFLHGLYDFSIITLPSPLNFMIPIMIITGLSIFISSTFNKIKKLKSICKI